MGGLVALVAVAAYADIPPPGQSECNGKKAGDKCSVGGAAGVCTASKCSRPDYSKGPPPSYRQVDCVLCLPEKKAAAPDGGSAAKPIVAPAIDADAGSAAAKPVLGETKPEDKPKPSSGGGCSFAR